MKQATVSGPAQIVIVVPGASQGGPPRHPSVVEMAVGDVRIAILAPTGGFDTLPKGLAQKGGQFSGNIDSTAHELNS